MADGVITAEQGVGRMEQEQIDESEMWARIVRKGHSSVVSRAVIEEVDLEVLDTSAYNEQLEGLVWWLVGGDQDEGYVVPGIPVKEMGTLGRVAKWRLDNGYVDSDDDAGKGLIVLEYSLGLSRSLIADPVGEWRVEERQRLLSLESKLTELFNTAEEDLINNVVSGDYKISEVLDDLRWMKERIEKSNGEAERNRVVGAELWGLNLKELEWVNGKLESMAGEVLGDDGGVDRIILAPIVTWFKGKEGEGVDGLWSHLEGEAFLEDSKAFMRLPFHKKAGFFETGKSYRHYIYHELVHFKVGSLGEEGRRILLDEMKTDEIDLWDSEISNYSRSLLSTLSREWQDDEKMTEAIAFYFSDPEKLWELHPRTYEAVMRLYEGEYEKAGL